MPVSTQPLGRRGAAGGAAGDDYADLDSAAGVGQGADVQDD